MFTYCCHEIGYSQQKKCYKCSQKAAWFCRECEKWHSAKEEIQVHQNLNTLPKNPKKVRLIGFFEGQTKVVVVNPRKSIYFLKHEIVKAFLKDKVKEEDLKYESSKYYLYTVKKWKVCDDFRMISYDFEDLDFILMIKKSLLEHYFDKLIDKIVDLLDIHKLFR